MKKILIYCDYGCSDVLPLKMELERYFKGQAIHVDYTDSAGILKHGALNKDVLMFCMPGGAANPYRNKLQTLGNQLIFDYVTSGGTYFGICAGAYYACRDSEFERGIRNLEIIEKYGLNLIEGRAIGTLHRQLRIHPFSKTPYSQIVTPILTPDFAQEIVFAHYHGGPYFELNNTSSQNVLATYAVKGAPAAVIERTVGQGRVILSGIHIENTGTVLAKLIHRKMFGLKQAMRMSQKLIKHEMMRRTFFDNLIDRCINK